MLKILLIFALFFAPTVGWCMYGEDTEPSEAGAQYTADKEDAGSITMPEMETEMPEAMQTIRNEQVDDPEEDYIEHNVTESMRSSFD